MITSEQCFSVWAPDGVAWTEWAKPVVFSTPTGTLPTDPPASVSPVVLPGVGDAWGQSAIIVDLPGVEAVQVGLALAERGYRPVPLFNGTAGPSPVIDLAPVIGALGAAAERLKHLALRPDAQPAFLLDARRATPSGAGEPGRYDNRWVVLPQDFPSVAFLASKGVREVTLIQRDATWPAEDLSHVLLRWQQAGVRLRVIDLATGRVEDDVRVREPSWFRRAWYVAITVMGFRRSNVGGFGSAVPQQTGSGGSGFYG
jgi:hypothetical protein